MRLRNIQHGPLSLADWQLAPGETACVIGPNASGKSLLAALIAGALEPRSGVVEDRPGHVSLLSFESLQAHYERELAEDDSDFLERIDYGSTGREILIESGAAPDAIVRAAESHGLANLLDRGCRQFSTGETRRIHLLKELLNGPDLLVLDEPYDGLDVEARQALDDTLRLLAKQGQGICVLVNHVADIPEFADSLSILIEGRIVASGPRERLLATPETQQFIELQAVAEKPIPELARAPTPVPSPLIRLRNGSVVYDGVYQFKDFDWTLPPGEHTFISGPNGSGKSTLLSLITGDHPQCYANDLRVLGYQRGTGESIWDIKREIGIVSTALHRDYRISATVETTVVSGFYDSIGLYAEPSAAERQVARQWLDFFGMETLARQSFRSLSYGQQRLALIARALVKQPPLLILDEPTQGLDDLNRHLVLHCLERLARLERTTLLLVSHLAAERLSLFRRHLAFRPDPSRGARYEIVNDSPVSRSRSG